ncbi:MAG: hypothetical protein HYY00_09240 [Chloroflexi bacterium]|nr:hypothetical protein [Chloroflexota bacterium]
MPQIFKALATISVWVLFINGAGSMVWTAIETLVRSGGIRGEPYNFSDLAWWTSAVASVFLALIAMKIRREME